VDAAHQSGTDQGIFRGESHPRLKVSWCRSLELSTSYEPSSTFGSGWPICLPRRPGWERQVRQASTEPRGRPSMGPELLQLLSPSVLQWEKHRSERFPAGPRCGASPELVGTNASGRNTSESGLNASGRESLERATSCTSCNRIHFHDFLECNRDRRNHMRHIPLHHNYRKHCVRSRENC